MSNKLNISCSYSVGSFKLSSFNLEVEQGEYLALLGASGSGKSVILELIAGLRRVESGKITFGELDCTDLPPQKRPFGYLFQDYALFPHLNVYENIAFPLRVRGVKKGILDNRVCSLAEEFSISDLLLRDTITLSGGEKQRVALARTLILYPSLLLLDEPLSALDAHLKSSSLSFLKSLSTERGLTVIHVTHDREEAESIADRIYTL